MYVSCVHSWALIIPNSVCRISIPTTTNYIGWKPEGIFSCVNIWSAQFPPLSTSSKSHISPSYNAIAMELAFLKMPEHYSNVIVTEKKTSSVILYAFGLNLVI